jgi:hypothetical protein
LGDVGVANVIAVLAPLGSVMDGLGPAVMPWSEIEDTVRRRRYGLQKREGYLTWRFVFLASLELDDPLVDPFFIDEARRPGRDPV